MNVNIFKNNQEIIKNLSFLNCKFLYYINIMQHYGTK